MSVWYYQPAGSHFVSSYDKKIVKWWLILLNSGKLCFKVTDSMKNLMFDLFVKRYICRLNKVTVLINALFCTSNEIDTLFAIYKN